MESILNRVQLSNNQTYKFDVIDEITVNNETFGDVDKPGIFSYNKYIVKIENIDKNFSVRKLNFQKRYPRPKSLYCKVEISEEGNIHLMQDRGYLFDNLFEEDIQYSFKVLSKEIDNNSESDYYTVEDEFNFKHRLYLNNNRDLELNIGSSVDCTVNGINREKGILILSLYNEKRISGQFISADRLFQEIEMMQYIDEYFYSIENNLEYKKESQKIFDDYYNKSSLWIFSYLNFHKFSTVKNIEKLKIITTISIEIDKWILESGFLMSFGIEKRQSIIIKTEAELSKNKAQLEAIEILENNKQDEYIAEISTKLNKGGYIINNEHKINVLKKILIINPETVHKQIIEISNLLSLTTKYSLLDEYDVKNFIYILDKRIQEEKYQLDKEYHFRNDNSFVKDRVKNIIVILGTQILLQKIIKDYSSLIIKLSMFYRYICYLNEDPKLIDLSVNILLADINSEPHISFEWEDIITFNISKILNSSTKDIEITNKDISIIGDSIIYRNKKHSASLEKINSQLVVFSKNQNNLGNSTDNVNIWASFFNNKLGVGSRNKCEDRVDSTIDIEKLNAIWENHTESKTDNKSDERLKSKCFKENDVLIVEFTNLNKKNEAHAFVKVVDDSYQSKSGLLHVKEVFPELNSLTGIFKPNDRFYAKILNVDTEGKLTFSLKQIISEKSKRLLYIGSEFLAKLQRKAGHYYYWLSDSCQVCSSIINPLEELEIGRTYLVRVVNNSLEFPTVEQQKICDVEIDVNNAFRNFISKHIIINEEHDDALENSKLLDVDNISRYGKELVNELIYIIDYLVSIETDIVNKFNLLHFGKLLSTVIGNETYLYFKAQTDYFLTLYRFSYAHIDVTQCIEDRSLKYFPYLLTEFKIVDTLSKLKKNEENEELFSSINNDSDIQIVKLSKLVLAYNLIETIVEKDTLLVDIRQNISELFFDKKFAISRSEIKTPVYNQTIEDGLINLGSEGQFKEFKSSIVFDAKTSKSDIESQMNIILKTIAGFLNSKGGVLYIGVDDFGEVIGLEKDFEELNANEDKYERLIRQKIVSNFNKDVNSTITINFKKNSINEVYCEIVIPEYNFPITLNDEFWHRQGNETRILKGQDVVLFIKRKVLEDKISIAPINKDLDITSNKDETEQIYPIDKVDNYSDLKRSNSNLHSIINTNSSSVLAYWNLFIDGKYIVTENQLNEPMVRISIPITENDRLKGYLLQCYDNACVNKVSVRTILEKNRGYIYSNGIYESANLVLACVIPNDMLLTIYTSKGFDKFIKLYSTSNVSTHGNLNLKGNQVICTDFDNISNYKLLSLEHESLLSKLVYVSAQPIGVSLTKKNYENEIEFVQSI